MDIPPHLIPQLTCSECSALLSSPPILVSSDGRSYCGQHDTQIPRNTAYEALAQIMRFPCKYRDKGCPEVTVWDSRHEDGCTYGEKVEKIGNNAETGEKCSICQANIYICARYECLRGHKICQTCLAPNSFRCQLCKSRILSEIVYVCKFWTFGCIYRSSKDEISRHEIDCNFRGYLCPFSTKDCKWSGATHKMSQHLKSAHFVDTIIGMNTTREFRMNDDSWVMVANEEVFQCYCWVGEFSVEWIAKYLGPQSNCEKLFCEVRLFGKSDKSVLKMTNKCHGWNSIYLDKCITVDLDDMAKFLNAGKCSFDFRIFQS